MLTNGGRQLPLRAQHEAPTRAVSVGLCWIHEGSLAVEEEGFGVTILGLEAQSCKIGQGSTRGGPQGKHAFEA